MSNKAIRMSTRVSAATQLEIKKYAAVKNITDSAAINELVRKALVGESDGCYAQQIQQAVRQEVNRLINKIDADVCTTAYRTLEEYIENNLGTDTETFCEKINALIDVKLDANFKVIKENLFAVLWICATLATELLDDNWPTFKQWDWIGHAQSLAPEDDEND